MHSARCIESRETVRDNENILTYVGQIVQSLVVIGCTAPIAQPKKTGHGRLAPWQSQRVLAYIRANLGARIRTPDLAVQARVSVGHFSRAFKATFGEAPAAFILKIKMVKAREIMLRTRRPLAQVALDCGMSDQAHFSRTFRRIVGLTPSRFRQQGVVSLRAIP
jgi:AraC family transcriptional regulator